jgi:glycosyltransferase involved in cell wall biosynthesis
MESIKKPITLGITAPCYNEENMVGIFIDAVVLKLEALIKSGEIKPDSFLVLVDDGSSDKTWETIESRCANSSMVKAIKFSRNFGHQPALLAGLAELKDKCDVNICMDSDLQMGTENFDTFLEKYYAGYDIVCGIKSSRKADPLSKKFFAVSFYKLMKFFGTEIIEEHPDFRLMSNKALTAMLSFKEKNLFLRGIIPRLGFKLAKVKFKLEERKAGERKYKFIHSLALSFNGITSASTIPLKMISMLGFIMLVFCLILSFKILIEYFLGIGFPGWAATVMPIYVLGGVQLLSLGVIGEYVGKIYTEVKGRPSYTIEDRI